MMSLSPEKKKQKTASSSHTPHLSPPKEPENNNPPENNTNAVGINNPTPQPNNLCQIPNNQNHHLDSRSCAMHHHLVATPMQYGNYFSIQSPYGGSPGPYYNNLQPNHFMQYGLFPPSPWSSGVHMANQIPSCFIPNNQADQNDKINPLSAPVEGISKPSNPIMQTDTTKLGNIAIGKTSYFASLSDDSPSPASKKKTTAKKQTEKAVDLLALTGIPPKIRTRSSGKGKMTTD